jgi:hypothetical protein
MVLTGYLFSDAAAETRQWVIEPTRPAVPVVACVPHGGREIPDQMLSLLAMRPEYLWIAQPAGDAPGVSLDRSACWRCARSIFGSRRAPGTAGSGPASSPREPPRACGSAGVRCGPARSAAGSRSRPSRFTRRSMPSSGAGSAGFPGSCCWTCTAAGCRWAGMSSSAWVSTPGSAAAGPSGALPPIPGWTRCRWS